MSASHVLSFLSPKAASSYCSAVSTVTAEISFRYASKGSRSASRASVLSLISLSLLCLDGGRFHAFTLGQELWRIGYQHGRSFGLGTFPAQSYALYDVVVLGLDANAHQLFHSGNPSISQSR